MVVVFKQGIKWPKKEYIEEASLCKQTIGNILELNIWITVKNVKKHVCVCIYTQIVMINTVWFVCILHTLSEMKVTSGFMICLQEA